ncbi:MAG: stage III sporulation protein AB [Coprococcus sp.]
MMLKIAGGILILIASGSIGHAIGRNQEVLASELSELLIMINLIKSELRYAVNELPEAFSDMAPRLNGAVGTWCEYMAVQLSQRQELSFEEIWNNGICRLDEFSRLKDKHIQYVEKLGKMLGYMDVEAQLAQLMLLESEIQHEYENEREKTGQIKKLAGSLGILGGLFLIIIMI